MIYGVVTSNLVQTIVNPPTIAHYHGWRTGKMGNDEAMEGRRITTLQQFPMGPPRFTSASRLRDSCEPPSSFPLSTAPIILPFADESLIDLHSTESIIGHGFLTEWNVGAGGLHIKHPHERPCATSGCPGVPFRECCYRSPCCGRVASWEITQIERGEGDTKQQAWQIPTEKKWYLPAREKPLRLLARRQTSCEEIPFLFSGNLPGLLLRISLAPFNLGLLYLLNIPIP